MHTNELLSFKNAFPVLQDSYSPHGFDSRSPNSLLSPVGAYRDSDEPRKRAPRALTGRYVRTGTAASPKVLQLLRKKIEDRLKLKELIGDGGPSRYYGSKSGHHHLSHFAHI
jgi:hypothetical protein